MVNEKLGFLTHLEGSGDPRTIYQNNLELVSTAGSHPLAATAA